MKQGRSLQQIAAELERQKEATKDYIAPQGKLEAKVVTEDEQGVAIAPEVVIDGLNDHAFGITPYAHGQLADNLEIPRKYYERMKVEQPELLTWNINTWLGKASSDKRMIRTLDGQIRAFLSPKYRPLDNFDLAEAVLPTLQALDVQVVSSELTATRFYIKGILPQFSDDLGEGMAFGEGHNSLRDDKGRGKVCAAIVVSNSEVGAGTLRLEPSVFTTWCTNLAIMAEAAMKKYHLGRSHDEAANYEVFRDATREADDKAFWLKVADLTKAALSAEGFAAAVLQIRQAAGQKIVSDDLPKVVEVLTKRLALPEAVNNSVLKHLIQGGDLSAWGLSSAITASANQQEDYELATELEHAGGKVIALSPADWKIVANAA
jgi:hypothetical protein